MRFLLRAAFWLTVVFVLMPASWRPSLKSDDAQPTLNALETAGKTAEEVADFCRDRPETCKLGGHMALGAIKSMNSASGTAVSDSGSSEEKTTSAANEGTFLPSALTGLIGNLTTSRVSKAVLPEPHGVPSGQIDSTETQRSETLARLGGEKHTAVPVPPRAPEMALNHATSSITQNASRDDITSFDGPLPKPNPRLDTRRP